MRSTFGIRSVGLLLALLGLALSGCGTIPEGLGTRIDALRLDGSSASLGRNFAPEATPRGEGDIASPPAMEAAAAPAEARADGPGGGVSPAAARVAADPTFVPVALDPIPPGSFHLIVLADRPEATPEPVTAEKPSATEPQPDLDEVEEYDPWESFNEKVFVFNYNFDKYVLKPVAKAYNFVMPDLFQQMIGRGFDNIRVIPKLVNNILQWNWKGVAVEFGRFAINSTLGIGGLFDIARQEFGLEKTKVDFGQTLGKWGFKPGPFLILPFMPPMTVRDGIGTGVDGSMDVLGYFLPFIPDRLVMRLGDIVNDRSLNLDLFQGFEETTVDLYSAVRNGYLQRRYNLIHGP